MSNLSIAQEYMVCAVSENGKISTSNTEKAACLVAAGLLELQLEGYISIIGKDVSVTNALPENKNYLRPLYDYIFGMKIVKINKIAETFTMSFSDKKFNELVTEIGESLVNSEVARKEKGGLSKNKTFYIPAHETVQAVIDMVKSEFLGNGEITEESAALIILLEKAGCLKKYFSDFERKEMKGKLQKVMDSPNGKLVKSIVDYLEGILVLLYVSAII